MSKAIESSAVCPHCAASYYSHAKRCPDVRWNGREVTRCLLERDHDNGHAYRRTKLAADLWDPEEAMQ